MLRTCASHPTLDPAVCTSCAMIVARRRARRRGGLVFVAMAVPVVAITAFLMTRPKRVPPPPRVQDQLEQDIRARLVQNPCEPRATMNLIEHSMEQQLDDVALADAYRSIGRCGVIDVVRWRITYLLQQKRQWIPAAIESTALLDEDPRDSDFWWWRGEAFAYADHPLLALADYRQSLANSDDAQAGGFATVRFGTPARAAGERCEGTRAWHYFVRVLGGEMTQEARDEFTALVRAGTCAGDDGTGHAHFPIDPMTGLGTAQVTIGGVTGRFQIDPAAGTTLVSRAFAEKTGLAAASSDRPITLYGGAMVSGRPARAPKIEAGGASAANVDVLVTDALGTDDDGVLGLSFLWHFDFTVEGGVTLAPPTHGEITAAR
jgi:hypothetical protein